METDTDLSSLRPGQKLAEEELVVSQEAADAYQTAVGEAMAPYHKGRVVPPLAVAALAMGTAMRSLALPAGAVHTAQELAFMGAVTPGVPIRCATAVAQNNVRRGLRFLVVQLSVTQKDQVVLEGRTSLAIAERSGS